MPLNDIHPDAGPCRILIVENHDDIREGLSRELQKFGHKVTVEGGRAEALAREDLLQFDLLVCDLISDPPETEHFVRSFKLAVTTDSERRAIPGLHDIIERTLSYKRCCLDPANDAAQLHEKIDLELPSDLTLMNSVLEYLLGRVEKLGMVEIEQSNLFVALDEAFVNAVKHGNRNNPEKLLRVTGELSAREAIFTVEDEGEGFDVREIPDPTDPANLFKSSGRGVLLIYNIMDEVEYSQGGAKLRMVKRPQNGTRPTESSSERAASSPDKTEVIANES
jgi:serine/threonine-protein kinase RsbW